MQVHSLDAVLRWVGDRVTSRKAWQAVEKQCPSRHMSLFRTKGAGAPIMISSFKDCATPART